MTNLPQQHLTIALSIPCITTEQDTEYATGYNIMPRMVHALEAEANRHNANILLYLNNFDPQRERENIENLLIRHVDALVILYVGGSDNTEYLQKVLDARIPTVLIDHYVDGIDCDVVTSDNYIGSYEATKKLIDSGNKVIYHITGVSGTSIRERQQGYIDAMQEAGLDPEIIRLNTKNGRLQTEDGRLIDRMVKDLVFPSALFASNAQILEEVWVSLENNDIPHGEISFACFDEPYTRLPEDVNILKVLQPLEEIGRGSIRILVDKIKGESEFQRVKIQPKIIAG